MTTDRKRTRLFVDRKVQGVLLRQLVLHWISAGLVVFVFLFIMQILSTTERMSFGEHVVKMWSQYKVAFVAILTVMPVFVYDSIKLSHRFAGPMVSLRNAMSDLAEGKPIEGVFFRKKDYWHDICVDVNAVAKRMDLLSENVAGNGNKPAAS